MFLTTVSRSTLRIGPYLFHIEKFITPFKTMEKNDRSQDLFSRKWQFTSMARVSRKKKSPFLMRTLMTCEIMRSRDVQCNILGNDLKADCYCVHSGSTDNMNNKEHVRGYSILFCIPPADKIFYKGKREIS